MCLERKAISSRLMCMNVPSWYHEVLHARTWALGETAMALFSYVCDRLARKDFRWWYN